MRIAIVHDWLNQAGGAEIVLHALKSLFPGAPVYTSMYWPAAVPEMDGWDIRVSFLDRMPAIHRRHQYYLPLYPLAFERFDFSGYDLVLSNKSGFCHGVITPANVPHLCYCLTPTRYLWQTEEYLAREHVGMLGRAGLRLILPWLRRWDRRAARTRVDAFAAISTEIQQRIRHFYRRESTVIYPPVDTQRFRVSEDGLGDYFLVLSRLVPYKRIDLAVKAFTALGRPLVIIGDGRDRPSLEAMAGPNVRFLGRQPTEAVREYLAHCQALIWPGLEDFGLAPVEAQASGRPVIAFAGGGALDTVIEGVTGTFFHEQTSEALAEAVAGFDPSAFDPQVIRQHALQFDVEQFRKRLIHWIADSLEQRQPTVTTGALRQPWN
ncbi:MAG: glycosyltransferase family 4 protein [Chloroflexi bacterium]|nr:MAG: glycosyltransferase family 4 protein [Chloroflexota bacterium]